jgi:uncharacterized protein (DUF1501 family)
MTSFKHTMSHASSHSNCSGHASHASSASGESRAAKGAGCNEYHGLTRRQFLGVSGAAAVAASVPAWLPRVAFGDPENSLPRDVLVSVFLRGGADGLTLCVPHGDPHYITSRPTLHIPPPGTSGQLGAINLDGFFGLPPSMASLLEPYLLGHLLFVQATGLVDPTRSHFDAMHFMEVGRPRDPNLLTGWLGRHLQTVAPVNANSVLRAVGISAGLQRQLAGAPKTMPIPDLDDTELNGRWETREERRLTIEQMYLAAEQTIKNSAVTTLGTMAVLNAINFAGYVPGNGAVYPNTYFGYSLKCAACLIKAQIGVEAIAIDLGGWDTHESQQPREGYMANLMREYADGLKAFYLDIIQPTTHRTTLVAMSEFGRNVQENASEGTDHGHGNIMMLMGRAIAGGRVLSDWPGLAPDLLYEGQDLQITIDYRDIVAEVVQRRLGNTNLATVLPGYTPTFRGVTV